MLKVVDIAAIVKIARSHGDIIVAVDNTFLSSYLQRPLDFGVDIATYSLTKYMNGHSDVIMGAAVVKDDALEAKLRFLQNGKHEICFIFSYYILKTPVYVDADADAEITAPLTKGQIGAP